MYAYGAKAGMDLVIGGGEGGGLLPALPILQRFLVPKSCLGSLMNQALKSDDRT